MTSSTHNVTLRARTSNEARFYMMVTPCPACGKGPWVLESAQQPGSGSLSVASHCRACERAETFAFEIAHDTPLSGSESETINPTDQPSEIVDLAQWLSLYYLLLERAFTETDRVISRQSSFQAALCLAEAMKFYTDGKDLPDETAFFSDASREVFRSHPDNFSRQRLSDMQGKLPSLNVMTRRIDRDHWVRQKKWWQFWRR
jgi:hypothetical protein